MKKQIFNGLVLAGGRSSRMGQDKGLLQAPDGRNLITRTENLLHQVGASEVFISSHNRDIADALQDKYPDRGPVSGIHAALLKHHDAPLLVLPVDMPLVTADLLNTLVQIGSDQETVCCFEQQCLPLFVFDTAVALQQAENKLREKDNISVWRFIKGLNHVEVNTLETQCFKNANNPQQWLECQQLMDNE